MTSAPYIPDSAPFSPEQRAWLNGLIAGLFSRQLQSGSAPLAASAASAASAPLTILYASQTGTCEGLAKKAAKEASKRGFTATLLDASSASVTQLAAASNLLVISSTYGDGEPPDSAKALMSSLHSLNGTQLPGVRFSVCALGDTNYAKFCQAGKDFDTSLERLGATRAAPRADCDLDYEGPFGAWLTSSLAALGTASATPPAPVVTEENETASPAYSKKNPYLATVLTVRGLNAAGSAKEVNHVEFALGDSGLTYQPGDALGVVPQNCPTLVAEVLSVINCDGEESVPLPNGNHTRLRRALTEFYDLGKPSPDLLALTGTTGSVAVPFHVIDALIAATKKPSAADLVAALKKIQPRLYSISSSPVAHAGQVHLTVGAVRYESAGRARKGLCSTFLAERATTLRHVGIYFHHNPNFRLPADATTPVIMVGPGTGIAPFRAFLAERRATGAPGKNWLFFGDQKSTTDFLYREELNSLLDDGHLTHLDLAWSRDQDRKVYVQDRMREKATELYAWLEAGAHFYVCGDASRMARDVHQALLDVVMAAGGLTSEQAADYVAKLQSSRRYQRDVY